MKEVKISITVLHTETSNWEKHVKHSESCFSSESVPDIWPIRHSQFLTLRHPQLPAPFPIKSFDIQPINKPSGGPSTDKKSILRIQGRV
jgi:hypothetical protein